MSLSGLFGNRYTEGWPVEWSGGYAWIGVPPADGIIDEDFLVSKPDSYQQVPRNVGIDILLEVWDKFTQGVSYTIETHEPLNSMQVTGEKGELMVCGQGQGHVIVFGKPRRNQLSIEPWAHAEPIIQIVSLSKLRNKYFATRCGDGHVNIYSSLSQPDRIA